MTFFEIVAECSIALAGFGAVHAVLQGAGGPRGILRAWHVVSQGCVAFILCVLVLLLDMTALSSETVWKSASIAGALGAGGLAATMFRVDAKMTQLGHPPQAPLNLRAAQLMFVLSTVLLVLNFADWPWGPGPVLYAAAVTLILLSGLLALLHSFFVPLQVCLSDEDADTETERPVA